MKSKDKNNFVLISDFYGALLEYIPDDTGSIIKKGENIIKIISPDSHLLFFEFLKRIKDEKYLMGYELNLTINGAVIPYSTNGFIKDEKINIIFLTKEDQTMKILAESIKINNIQVNELRKKYKEKSLEKTKIEDEVYFEITKLNNELLNSKRTIEKQNAQLSKYNLLLEDLSMKDSLTGAYNRRYFYDKIPEIASKLALKQGNMFFTAIDLNYFKKLNDIYGHDFGDKMLKDLVGLLNKESGEKDLVFRIGGDEFVVVFIDKTKEEIERIMDRVAEGYEKLTTISSISYGMIEIELSASKKLTDNRIENYLKKADRLMYDHKAKVKSVE